MNTSVPNDGSSAQHLFSTNIRAWRKNRHLLLKWDTGTLYTEGIIRYAVTPGTRFLVR